MSDLQYMSLFSCVQGRVWRRPSYDAQTSLEWQDSQIIAMHPPPYSSPPPSYATHEEESEFHGRPPLTGPRDEYTQVTVEIREIPAECTNCPEVQGYQVCELPNGHPPSNFIGVLKKRALVCKRNLRKAIKFLLPGRRHTAEQNWMNRESFYQVQTV